VRKVLTNMSGTYISPDDATPIPLLGTCFVLSPVSEAVIGLRCVARVGRELVQTTAEHSLTERPSMASGCADLD
jgi:hypothetical protein